MQFHYTRWVCMWVFLIISEGQVISRYRGDQCNVGVTDASAQPGAWNVESKRPHADFVVVFV